MNRPEVNAFTFDHGVGLLLGTCEEMPGVVVFAAVWVT